MIEKYQATGNDFILSSYAPSKPSETAKKLCDRHFGIGADGYIYPVPSTLATIGMKYFNSDGSEAPMCGNGLRTFVRFVIAQERVDGHSFTVETRGGIFAVESKQETVRINLGKPILTHHKPDTHALTHMEKALHFTVDNKDYELHVLTLGTIHGVVFVDDFKTLNFHHVGKTLSTHPFFQRGINVNFVKIKNPRHIEVRTYERGAGATLSCGTGVASSAYVAHHVNKTDKLLTVTVPGGSLSVDVEEHVFLEGPAQRIASITMEEGF